MGFNLGAFLGGAARGGSQVLDERRAQADRDKVTKEERQWQIATEARADSRSRKAARRKEKENIEEQGAYLASLGWNPDSVESILKGGSASVKQWGEIGVQHRSGAKDFDMNLLIKNQSPTDSTTISSAVGDVKPAKPTTINQSEAWKLFGQEPDPVFQDLNKEFAYYSSKALNATNPTQKEKFQKLADNAIVGLKTKATELKEEGEDTDNMFSKLNITTLQQNNRVNGGASVGVAVDRGDNILIRRNGDEGRYAIGTLRGLQIDKSFNVLEDGSIASFTFDNAIKAQEKQAFQNLKSHATSHIGGTTVDGVTSQYKTVTSLLETLGQQETGPDIKTLPGTDTANTEYLSTREVTKLYGSGTLDYGDIYKYIDSRGNFVIGIYTGDVGKRTQEGEIKTSYNYKESRIQ